MAILNVQKFDGLEEMDVYFDWAERLDGNRWTCEDLNLWEFSRELMALNYSEFDADPKVVGTLVKRLQGAISKALKETGGWRPADREQLWVKQLSSDGTTLTTLEKLGLISYRNVGEGFELKFRGLPTVELPNCKTIVGGLNAIEWKGGNWEYAKISYLPITEH
jgi:hypothetical protein